MSTKNLIPILGAVMVIGALIQRDFQRVGLIVALSAIAIWLAAGFRTAIRNIWNFQKVSHIAKVRIFTFLTLFYLFIHAIVTGKMPYFMVLLILGIEYWMADRQKTEP